MSKQLTGLFHRESSHPAVCIYIDIDIYIYIYALACNILPADEGIGVLRFVCCCFRS